MGNGIRNRYITIHVARAYRSTKMEEELKSRLDKVESELICVEQQLEQILQRQQSLQERKEMLIAQLESFKASVDLETKQATDWEKGQFPWSEKVKGTLLSVFKITSFRPLQASCVNATLSLRDAILIMPTGGGKSLCYQLPALLSPGITLVVSPLVSLMEDQLMSVKSLAINASLLNASTSRTEATQIQNSMTDKQSGLKLLYVTPEKIAKSKRFMSKLEKTYELGLLSRIVIDEIHCASQWGHDFRPDYKILGILKNQFPQTPILGLTATATSKILTDVKEMLLLKQCLIFRASYNRSNLFYEVRVKPAAHKTQIDEIADLIKTRFSMQSGIVYCLSRKDSERVCLDLCGKGISAGCYHADLPPDERSGVHRKWLNKNVQVIVATVAFGMGIDKPDVRFVIHHTISKSIENYYQESGRAGRDGSTAHCIVYFRATDVFRQSTMVFTEHTGLQNLYTIVRYCLNRVHCRRSLIASSFEEQWKPEDCNNSCDICQRLSNSSDNLAARSGTSSYFAVDNDVSGHCQSLVEIIEQAQQKQQRLTALKLVEVWKKKTSNVSMALSGEAACDADTRREEIILHAVLEGVLKEEFHFTPYSTISYIGLGRKAAGVKRGILRVIMKHMVRETESLSFKRCKSTTSTLERADKLASDSSHSMPAGAGPSVKKRVLPKMILDAPTDEDDFKPRIKKRRTQSNKTDSCQTRERTVTSTADLGNQDYETTGVADVIMID